MSYEGYEQVLCRKGHYHIFDAFDEPDYKEWKCPDCGEPVAWTNGVDTTNVGYEGIPPDGEGFVELEEVTAAVTCKCDKCGHIHEVHPPTYKIPEKRS